MLKRANTDVLAGLTGVLVFGIFWLAREDWRPSSAVWPESILYAIIVLSVILLVRGVIQRDVSEIFGEGSKRRMAIAAGGLAAWGIAVHYIGFVVASFILFVALTWFVTRAEQRTSPEVAPSPTLATWALWFGIIVVEIGLLYFVFSKVLLVPLPQGIAF